MRRDIGSEVVVAIVAVLLLAFALIFGVVLSLSGGGRGVVLQPTATTSADTAASVADGTAIVQTLQVGTQVVRLLTASAAAPAVTDSAEADFAGTATALSAEVLTAAASTASASGATSAPAVVTATSTPVPPTVAPTNTPTPVPPTVAPTNTQTPVPPTVAPTNTQTHTPSHTPTATFTHTSSHTPTHTPTLTPSHTPTPPLPTAVMLPADGSIPTLALTPQFLCALPFGWSTYTVQPGDTLFQIALAAGVSVGELRDINCLSNEDAPQQGLDVYVPQPLQVAAPTAVTPTRTPGAGTPTGAPRAAEGCSATAAITSPLVGAPVEAVTTVFGTAVSDGAAQYLLEVRPEGSARYTVYLLANPPVTRGALGRLNPAFFPPGEYWLRLTILDGAGRTLEACAIPVIFR